MLKRVSGMTAWLLLLALGCAGGDAAQETEPEAEPPTQPARQDAPAPGETQLPLVIEAVTGDPDTSEEAEQIDPAELEALRSAVAANPNDATVHRRLAIKLHGANLRNEAIPHFERAAKLNPDVRALLDLALAYNSVSRIAEAEATYAKLLELSPGNPVALHNLGTMVSKRGEVDRAISYYQRSLESDPNYLMAQYHLANALERAERYEEAYAAFGEVWQEMEPTNAKELALFDDALYRMASLDIKMGAYPRAAEMLAELLRANPDHESAHYAYGQVLLRLGRVDEAQREFEAHMRVLSEQHPKSPVAMGE
jgi:tetratricopeptide (TPR) repeat protein